jgi:predicted alpha/beta superfamily hydrolase
VLDIFPIYSPLLKNERFVRVYLPKDYLKNEEKNYPVLYMHDGQNVFRDEDAIGGISLGLEKYLDENELEVIVVGIDQNSEERKNEYCPWVNGEYSKKLKDDIDIGVFGGKGKQYIEFIVNELKPFIDDTYRTLKDCNAMVGISLGGLISTYAACRYPHIFRNVAVLSSAFYANQEEIEKLLQNTDLSDIKRFYLDCGTKEAAENERINKEFLVSNTAVSEILREKITNSKIEIVSNAEHSYLCFRKRVPDIFSFLLTDLANE